MPFEVKCDKCDAKFALTEDLYTRKVKGRVVTIKCKSCKAGIQVDGTVMPDDSPPGQTPTVPLAGPGMLKSSGNELEPTPTVPLSLGGSDDAASDDLWLISFGDDDDREMTSVQIADALLKGSIDDETIVWRDGMDDWLPLSAVAELRLAVSQAQRAQATGGFLGTGMSLGKKGDSPPDSDDEAPISIEPESLNPDSIEEVTTGGPVALAAGTMGKAPEPPRPPPARNVPGGTKVGLPAPPEVAKPAGKKEFPKPPAIKKAEPKKPELPKPPALKKGGAKPEPVKPAPPPRKMPEPPKPPSPAAAAPKNEAQPKPALPKPPPLKKRGDAADQTDGDAAPKPPKAPALRSLAGSKTEDNERAGEDVLGLAAPAGDAAALGSQGVDLADLGKEAPPEPADEPPKASDDAEPSEEAEKEKRPAMVATAAQADAPVAIEPADEKKKGSSTILLIAVAAAVVFGVYWFGMRKTDGPVAVNTPTETSEAPLENPSSPAEEPTAEPATEPSEEPTEEPSEEPSEPAGPSDPSRLVGTSGGENPPSTGGPVAPTTPEKPEKPEAPEKPEPEPDKPSKPEPSAPAPGSDPPTTPDKPKGSDNPFDKGAAAAALGSAAAQASGCRKASDPSGRARVTVTFAPSGRVTNAVVSGPPFAGTPTGGCIAATMRRARVPPFSGGAKTVGKTVVIN